MFKLRCIFLDVSKLSKNWHIKYVPFLNVKTYQANLHFDKSLLGFVRNITWTWTGNQKECLHLSFQKRLKAFKQFYLQTN